MSLTQGLTAQVQKDPHDENRYNLTKMVKKGRILRWNIFLQQMRKNLGSCHLQSAT